jgi:hypothetical protein
MANINEGNANTFSFTLYTANPTLTIPLTGENPGLAAIRTKDLVYPCTIWVLPKNGSTISVSTSPDGTTQIPWTAGTVSTATQQTYNSCPGSITFTLVSGASALVGIN